MALFEGGAICRGRGYGGDGIDSNGGCRDGYSGEGYGFGEELRRKREKGKAR